MWERWVQSGFGVRKKVKEASPQSAKECEHDTIHEREREDTERI